MSALLTGRRTTDGRVGKGQHAPLPQKFDLLGRAERAPLELHRVAASHGQAMAHPARRQQHIRTHTSAPAHAGPVWRAGSTRRTQEYITHQHTRVYVRRSKSLAACLQQLTIAADARQGLPCGPPRRHCSAISHQQQESAPHATTRPRESTFWWVKFSLRAPHQPQAARFCRSPADRPYSLHASSERRISDSLPHRPAG
jgi:hypothetical protein